MIRNFGITVGVSVIGLALAAMIAFLPVSEVSLPVLIVATLVVLAAPIIYRACVGRLDPFEPIVCFALVWGLMFVLKPLEILSTGDTSLRNSFDVRGGLESASVLGLIGAAAFVLVYELTFGRRRGEAKRAAANSNADRSTPELPPPPLWLILSCVGIASLGMLVLAGTSLTEAAATGSSAYQYLAPLLAIPGIVLLLLKARTGGSGWAISAVILLGLAVIFFVFFGQRAFILMPVSSVFVFYFFARQRRPSWALLGAIALFVVLPVFTLIEVTREHPDQSTLGALQRSDITSPAAAVKRFTEGDTTAMYPALALQMSTEGSTWTQQPGHEIASVTTRFVPQQLWPGKPRSSSEELYSRYFPAHYEINRAGTLFTLVSEFYYDSGIVGVILGMSLVGWAFARLWLWVISRPREAWAWGLYAPVLAMSTIIFRGDLALSFGLGLFIFGPILLGFAIARRQPRRVTNRPGRNDRATREITA